MTEKKTEHRAVESRTAHTKHDAETGHDNPGITSELKPHHTERKIDKGLMDSFPASDPPSASHFTGAEVVTTEKGKSKPKE